MRREHRIRHTLRHFPAPRPTAPPQVFGDLVLPGGERKRQEIHEHFFTHLDTHVVTSQSPALYRRPHLHSKVRGRRFAAWCDQNPDGALHARRYVAGCRQTYSSNTKESSDQHWITGAQPPRKSANCGTWRQPVKRLDGDRRPSIMDLGGDLGAPGLSRLRRGRNNLQLSAAHARQIENRHAHLKHKSIIPW